MATKVETVLVTMICPNLACRRAVSAPESARGMTVRCAYCQTPFRVPATAITPPEGEAEEEFSSAPRGKKKR